MEAVVLLKRKHDQMLTELTTTDLWKMTMLLKTMGLLSMMLKEL